MFDSEFWIAMLGQGNGVVEYLLVLVLYGAMFLLIRHGSSRLELSARKSFWILALAWGPGIFVGNYLCYLVGVMGFLPWLNNAFHTLIWIALCLGWLYAGVHKRPMMQQVPLFIIFSFLVKIGELMLLGSWHFDHFFGIRSLCGLNDPLTYIIGWSVMDGLYPAISVAILGLARRFTTGIIRPGAGT